ncbi:hypothetical protein [Asticcacaulis sp. YBE204]|uniref:hypothetical protein n=1 Tax=Asticcacaulis sp. YBE204 TaxID=1282363 RepID=UPI0003C3F5E6|nr:hypothetical protein [Asticcacaulis sp. YBE204]ESQ78421.1 hypothetical protein AEYBE204_14715 [Asticcacaulis sp. YBE204]
MRATATSTEALNTASASASSVAPPVVVPEAMPAPDSLTAADVTAADALIKQVNANGLIQTHFAASPPRQNVDYGWLRKIFEFFGKIGEFIADVLKPIAPILPYIMYLALFALIVFLLSPVVRAMITARVERLFQRDNLKADAPWRPTAEAAAALLEEIDALAAQGEYDEAVHLLLKRSVADLNAYRPDLVRKHYSARDIGKHPLLPEDARPTYAEITRWAEKSYFAGIKVGREGFEACRKAYVDFVSIKGIV